MEVDPNSHGVIDTEYLPHLPPMHGRSSPIIFYDGVCGLCSRLNQFILEHDHQGVFRFAALQTEYAHRALAPYGFHPRVMNTFYVLVDPGLPTERLLSKARAALFVLRRLSGVWRVVALLGLLPVPLLDFGYDLMARSRYRLFGRSDSCLLPELRWRDRFIEIQ